MVPEGPWASHYHGDRRAAPCRWGSESSTSTARVKEGRAHPRPRNSHLCREALQPAENRAGVGRGRGLSQGLPSPPSLSPPLWNSGSSWSGHTAVPADSPVATS